MVPGLDAAHERGTSGHRRRSQRCEQALTSWQLSWDNHAQAVALGQRETQVERARIEQLESQQRRLLQQQERQEAERESFAQLQPPAALEALARARRDRARVRARAPRPSCKTIVGEISATREREREQSQSLNALRARLQQAQGEQVSTEALQQAALGKASGRVTQWLKSQSLDRQPRVAQQLRVDKGWERAVETVLGSYLEAVCVDGLDSVTDLLASFDGGYLAVVSTGRGRRQLRTTPPRCRPRCRARPCSVPCCRRYIRRRRWPRRSRLRRQLKPGESVVTRDGIWLGNDWLRVSRDADPHTGVIEREEILREIGAQVERARRGSQGTGKPPGSDA